MIDNIRAALLHSMVVFHTHKYCAVMEPSLTLTTVTEDDEFDPKLIVLIRLATNHSATHTKQDITDIVNNGECLTFFIRTDGPESDFLENLAAYYENIPGIENIHKIIEISAIHGRVTRYFTGEYKPLVSTEWNERSKISSIAQKYPKFCANLTFLAYGTETPISHRLLRNTDTLKIFVQSIIGGVNYCEQRQNCIALKMPITITTTDSNGNLTYFFDSFNFVICNISLSALTDIFSTYCEQGWQQAAEKITLTLSEPFLHKTHAFTSDKEVVEWMRQVYAKLVQQHKLEQNELCNEWKLFRADLHMHNIEEAAPIRKLRELFCRCVGKLNDEQLQQIEDCILDGKILYIETRLSGTSGRWTKEARVCC